MEEEYGFGKGYGQITITHAVEIKNELMKLLSINSEMMWWRRLNGKGCRPLSLAERIAVERVFLRFGVQCGNVWGKE